MGRWTDLATWRGPTPNQTLGKKECRGVVIHIAEGSYEGTIAWCKNPSANVSAHFVIGKNGQIAQLVDTDDTAWTQRSGNGHWLSIENEGFTPGALTAAQAAANARILVRAHQVYGVPLQVCTSPSGRGLGHHSMGAESGVNWGHSDCPGPAIIAQKPGIVAYAAEYINGGKSDMDPNGHDIHPDLPNRQVFRDLWDWTVGDRSEDDVDAGRFHFPTVPVKVAERVSAPAIPAAEIAALLAADTTFLEAIATGVADKLKQRLES